MLWNPVVSTNHDICRCYVPSAMSALTCLPSSGLRRAVSKLSELESRPRALEAAMMS